MSNKKRAKQLMEDKRMKYLLGVIVLMVLVGVIAVLCNIEANPTEDNPTQSEQGQDEEEKGGLKVEEQGDGDTIDFEDITDNKNQNSGDGNKNTGNGDKSSGNGDKNTGNDGLQNQDPEAGKKPDEDPDKNPDNDKSDGSEDFGKLF